MANFCKQCSIELFGKDSEDLKGITSQEDWKQEKAAVVICEGCNIIQVDPDGKCIPQDRLRNHRG